MAESAVLPDSLMELVASAAAADPPAAPAPEPTSEPVAADAGDAVPVPDGEPEPGAEPAAEPVTAADDDPKVAYVALKELAKEVLGEGETGYLDRYESVEDFLRASRDQEKTLGQARNAVAQIRRLQDAGVSDEDIRQLLASKNGAAPGGNGKPIERTWKEEWLLGEGADGKPLFAPDAPTDAPELHARYMKEFRAAALKGPVSLRKFLDAASPADVEQGAGRVRQESQQQQTVREANERQAAWTQANAKHIWVDGVQEKGFTPLGQKVIDLAYPHWRTDGNSDPSDSVINSSLPPDKRLQVALDYITAQMRPAPVAAKPSPKGGRTPAPAGNRQTMTTTQWLAKHRDDPPLPGNDPDPTSMERLAAAVAAGIVKD